MPALSLADEILIFAVSCACLHLSVLTCALLHSHAPWSAIPRFAAFPCCERSALLPVLGHPVYVPWSLVHIMISDGLHDSWVSRQ